MVIYGALTLSATVEFENVKLAPGDMVNVTPDAVVPLTAL
jgi:hypothetical protein